MAPDKTYQLYRHKQNGRYITARHLGYKVEVFPESGHAPRRQPTLLEPENAGRLLTNYDFTGISFPRCNMSLPGNLFVRPSGGFFLSIESAGGDSCAGLDADGSGASIRSISLTGLFDEIADGRLEPALPETTAAPETGRFYSAGGCYLTIFEGERRGLFAIHPENGWCSWPVTVESSALGAMLESGSLKPLAGRLFKIAGPGQLPHILTKYSTFEDLETGQTISISKISKYQRSVEASSSISYNTLITMVCAKQLVPYIGIHF